MHSISSPYVTINTSHETFKSNSKSSSLKHITRTKNANMMLVKKRSLIPLYMSHGNKSNRFSWNKFDKKIKNPNKR